MATTRACSRGNICASWVRTIRRIGRSTRRGSWPPNKKGRVMKPGLPKTPARIVRLCSEWHPEKPALSGRFVDTVYTDRLVNDPKKTPATDFGFERVEWDEKQRRV